MVPCRYLETNLWLSSGVATLRLKNPSSSPNVRNLCSSLSSYNRRSSFLNHQVSSHLRIFFFFFHPSIFFIPVDASKVHVLVRRDKLRASKVMADRLIKHPKVEVVWNTVATETLGDGSLLRALTIQNTVTGAISKLDVNGLFYAIGEYNEVEINASLRSSY